MKIFSCGVFVCLLCWGLHPVPLYAGQALSGELHSFINFVKCFSTGQLNDLALENNTDLSCSPHVGTHTSSLTILVHFIFFFYLYVSSQFQCLMKKLKLKFSCHLCWKQLPVEGFIWCWSWFCPIWWYAYCYSNLQLQNTWKADTPLSYFLSVKFLGSWKAGLELYLQLSSFLSFQNCSFSFPYELQAHFVKLP